MSHLRQAMLEELHRRNYATSTITYYVKNVENVEQFVRYFRRSPDRLNQTHLRTYQAYLLRERKPAPRTVKLHVCAIRFLFYKILRHIVTQYEFMSWNRVFYNCSRLTWP